MLNANFVMQGILETAVNVLFSNFLASSNFVLHQILCCLKFNASSNLWCRQLSSIGDWWLDKKTRQKGFPPKRLLWFCKQERTSEWQVCIDSSSSFGDRLADSLRVRFFGKIRKRVINERSLKSRCIKKNEESFPRVDSLVPLRDLPLLYDIIGGLK